MGRGDELGVHVNSRRGVAEERTSHCVKVAFCRVSLRENIPTKVISPALELREHVHDPYSAVPVNSVCCK